MLAIRLTQDIESRLTHLAQETGLTKTALAREAILEHIDDLEDYYLAAVTMERVRKGEEKVYSAEQVRDDLGLDD
jgi:RHH-type rel operon transcriptional repressor/antitoxin RelB